MKNLHKWFALLLVVCVMAVCLTGCSGSFDAATFVKGNLDALYLGIANEEFLALVVDTKEDLLQTYEAGLVIEAEYFFGYFDIVEESIPPEMKTEVIDMYRQIFSNSNYEIGEAVESGDNYIVPVTVYPIDIIYKVMEDFEDFMTDWNNRWELGTFDNMSAEDFETLWAREMIDLVKARLGSIGHLEAETISMQIVSQSSNGSNFYTIREDDMRRIDALIINYPSG